MKRCFQKVLTQSLRGNFQWQYRVCYLSPFQPLLSYKNKDPIVTLTAETVEKVRLDHFRYFQV